MSDPVKIRCPNCDAKLQVKPHLLGTSGKCPKCSQSIPILGESEKPPVAAKSKSTSHLPATQKQKDYALALGCQFDDTITRGAISALIDVGKIAEEERRFERIEAIENRQFSAVNAIRNELIESDDPPVSASTPRQMVDSLDERDTCAVLITLPFDQIDSFDDLEGVDIQISGTDSMSDVDVADVVRQVNSHLQRHSSNVPLSDPESILQSALVSWRDNDSCATKREHIEVFLGDTGALLLAFDVITCNEVPVGKLMEVPPKPVVRDFEAVVGVALAERPAQRTPILAYKLNPGRVKWCQRRYLIRQFVDEDWLVFIIND